MRLSARTTIIALAIVAIGLGGQAYAFHDGGVADCAGCHSMHSSVSTIVSAGGGDYGYLLTATDQSSTCLNCHEQAGLTSPSSYHMSTAAADLVNDTDVVAQRTPGGDFGASAFNRPGHRTTRADAVACQQGAGRGQLERSHGGAYGPGFPAL